MERILCVSDRIYLWTFPDLLSVWKSTGYRYPQLRKRKMPERPMHCVHWAQKAGAITLLGDCFKCVIAVVIVHLIFWKKAIRR